MQLGNCSESMKCLHSSFLFFQAQPQIGENCLTNDLVTVSPCTSSSTCSALTCSVDMASVGVQTDETELALTEEVSALRETIKKKDEELKKQNLRLQNICNDDAQVLFYTGFHSYALLEFFFQFPWTKCQ